MPHDTARHFDYLVIGGGSGGYAAARTALETCERVAVVDGSDELGGLCILRGCMPSKTLIHAADVLHHARHGKDLGLEIPAAAADMAAVQERKRRIIEEFAAYRRGQLEDGRFSLFRSRARFADRDTVELEDGTRLTADHIMVATGSVVNVPQVKGLADTPFWTSDDILDLDFLPPKIIVLGAGIVACELSQMLRRMGTEVIKIQRSPQTLRDYPQAASATIERAMRAEGIEIYTGTVLEEVRHEAGVFHVSFRQDGKNLLVEAPYLLNALGRRPATDGLNLEAAGIETLPSGQIRCDTMQRTTNPRVYACGDVAGPNEIVHIAILQGETAARHATGRPADPVDYDTVVDVVFTDPQIGTAGLGETQLKERGIDYLAADYPFDDHGKSILMEAVRGYVKVFASKPDGRILGAECVGREGGELIHTMAVAVSLKATVFDLLKTHWYHPTLSEIWTYPLEDIAEALSS